MNLPKGNPSEPDGCKHYERQQEQGHPKTPQTERSYQVRNNHFRMLTQSEKGREGVINDEF